MCRLAINAKNVQTDALSESPAGHVFGAYPSFNSPRLQGKDAPLPISHRLTAAGPSGGEGAKGHGWVD